jgi:hypothetical protein
MERRAMYMRDWIAKLDGFLRLSDKDILEHAGRISAEEARKKAELEFHKFDELRRQLEDAQAGAAFESVNQLERQDEEATAEEVKRE